MCLRAFPPYVQRQSGEAITPPPRVHGQIADGVTNPEFRLFDPLRVDRDWPAGSTSGRRARPSAACRNGGRSRGVMSVNSALDPLDALARKVPVSNFNLVAAHFRRLT